MSYLGGLSVLSALDDLATRPTTAFVEPYDPAPKVENTNQMKNCILGIFAYKYPSQ